MRGKLSDQDLTNYALNDGLEARERLYVESMLGLSEECRSDVYKMMDMAQLLERGFEQQSGKTVPRLTRVQREQLLNAKPRFEVLPFVRKTAASLSLAACVAFMIANPAGLFQEHHRTVAAVSSGVTRLVDEVLSSNPAEDYTRFVEPQSYDETEDSTLIQASSDGMPMPVDETICTPPSGTDVQELSVAE